MLRRSLRPPLCWRQHCSMAGTRSETCLPSRVAQSGTCQTACPCTAWQLSPAAKIHHFHLHQDATREPGLLRRALQQGGLLPSLRSSTRLCHLSALSGLLRAHTPGGDPPSHWGRLWSKPGLRCCQRKCAAQSTAALGVNPCPPTWSPTVGARFWVRDSVLASQLLS